jgi:hypothetical protein
VKKAAATVKYEASGGYLRYRYSHSLSRKRLTLEFAGNGSETELAILLPKGARPKAARLDGRSVPAATHRVEGSLYACLSVRGVAAHKVEVILV